MCIQRLGGKKTAKKKNIFKANTFPARSTIFETIKLKEEDVPELFHNEYVVFPNFPSATKILTEEYIKYGTKRRV